jgi:hypothetical protein
MNMKSKTVVGVVACLVLAGSMSIYAQEKDACGKPMTDAKKSQRALDMLEIQNVASAHEYYHGAFLHNEEIRDIWSKRDDIAWKNNNDYYANRKDFNNFYGVGIKQANPLGALWYHMLTTPIIEVSGDGQTAQAIWMSFGNVSGAGGTGTMSQWTEEKYSMDFIKEDGKWKIWHLRTYVEYYSPFQKSWTESNLAAPTGSANEQKMGGGAPPSGDKDKSAGGPPQGQAGQQGGAPPQGGQQGASAPPQGQQGGTAATVKEEPGAKFDMKPTENGNYYEGYHPERVKPVIDPIPPMPYCTWKDTTPTILQKDQTADVVSGKIRYDSK